MGGVRGVSGERVEASMTVEEAQQMNDALLMATREVQHSRSILDEASQAMERAAQEILRLRAVNTEFELALLRILQDWPLTADQAQEVRLALVRAKVAQ